MGKNRCPWYERVEIAFWRSINPGLRGWTNAFATAFAEAGV
jgi:hypothetical protein